MVDHPELFLLAPQQHRRSDNTTTEAREVEENGKWRGIPYNDPDLTHLFKASGSQIFWAYNWDSISNGAETFWEFVPMLWSDTSDHTSRWFDNVDKAVKAGTWHVLSFNEPDGCANGGSCMQDIGRAVYAYRQYIHPLYAKYDGNVRLSAPAVTNGAPPMGLDYLRRFLSACNDCRIDWVVIHWYGAADNSGDFKKHAQEAYEAGGKRPIWITEFGAYGSEDQIIGFLNDVLPWLDHPDQKYIYRYAYQWAAPGSLVNGVGDGLSAIGQLYAFH
ncbi:uncharacterized protein BDR25DRAFT_329670 [Lindgomyces ingoldianus]|uniref:Uncharacterized protein n=1 Tax=Lindgomyces ingoldianus TaxID=673940 RepID=A0ACB6QBB3_9PLEO|nr:uncharacterized protein BDR25DRAFT_329670 [Lindgomyces ingoldianus]KAF2463430.1 hypothetical protein BDR25DRAFT_329670 [Lindgomyces ingoldianus]